VSGSVTDVRPGTRRRARCASCPGRVGRRAVIGRCRGRCTAGCRGGSGRCQAREGITRAGWPIWRTAKAWNCGPAVRNGPADLEAADRIGRSFGSRAPSSGVRWGLEDWVEPIRSSVWVRPPLVRMAQASSASSAAGRARRGSTCDLHEILAGPSCLRVRVERPGLGINRARSDLVGGTGIQPVTASVSRKPCPYRKVA
jgi:hypothetical protein